MATGRSRGPASPSRGRSGARPAAGSGTRPARPAASRPAATRPSTARAGASRARGTSATGAPTTAKVVQRDHGGWRVLGGAVTNRLTRRTVVVLAICAFLAVLLSSTVAAWIHQQGQIAALQAKVAGQEQDVAGLRAEQERWKDPAYVEQQARQRLKFVKPGEMSYTVLDPAPAKGAPALPADVADPGTTLPWYETVWESARTADAPAARR